MAATIHVARRLDQERMPKFCRSRVRFGRSLPSESAFVSKKIGNHEANVVASMRVFGAGVAQTCDQANRLLFHCRAIEIRNQCQSGSDKSILLLWLFFFWSLFATLAPLCRPPLPPPSSPPPTTPTPPLA